MEALCCSLRFSFHWCALNLGHTRDIFALEVVLKLSNLFATLDPALAVGFTPLLGQLVKGGPVDGVVVFEFDLTTHGLHELAGRNVFAQVFVKLELLSGIWVDERRDQLEESPNEEGYCEVMKVSWGNGSQPNISLTIDHQGTP